MNHRAIAAACVLTLSFGVAAGMSVAQRAPDLTCYDAAKVEVIAAWAQAEEGCIAVEGAYSEGCQDIARRGAKAMKQMRVDPAKATLPAVCVPHGRSPLVVA